MASSNVILHRTEKAAQDLSALQFTLVKYNSSGNLVPATEGDTAFVLEDTPKSGEHGTIAVLGIAKVQLGGTVAAGDHLASDPSGHAILADSADSLIGLALGAGVAGDKAEILVPAPPFQP